MADDGFDTKEFRVLMAEVNRFGVDSSAKARELTYEYSKKLLSRIRDNASRRPGPRMRTGQYVASWRVDFSKGLGFRAGYSASVVSDAPQAYRLEYGFVGVDSKGRHYAQPPFPHIGPAVDAIVPQWQQAMADEISGWWR